ncbi:MAG TPA: four helix bundle protein [Chitinophagaceae bacterium]|nr:four helix bundle protein [Chitinophagaceae bacterium]
MREFYFEKLEVWKEARIFTREIYIVSKNFPDEEKFGLTSQIRRSAMSISANIAEGSSRKTDKDKARFINVAYSSAIEVLNYLILSKDLEWLKKEEYIELREKIEKITNQLNSFYKVLSQ